MMPRLHFDQEREVGFANIRLLEYPTSRSRIDVVAREKYTKKQWIDEQVTTRIHRSRYLCFPKQFYLGVKYPYTSIDPHKDSRAVIDFIYKWGDICDKVDRKFTGAELELAAPTTLEKRDDLELNDYLEEMWMEGWNDSNVLRAHVVNKSLLSGKSFPDVDEVMKKRLWCKKYGCKEVLETLLDLDPSRGAIMIASNNIGKISSHRGSTWSMTEGIKLRVVNGLIPRKNDEYGNRVKEKLLGMLFKHALGNSQGDTVALLHVHDHVERDVPGTRTRFIREQAMKRIFSYYKDGMVSFPDDVINEFWGKDIDPDVVEKRRKSFVMHYPSRLKMSCKSLESIRNEVLGKTGMDDLMRKFRTSINRKFNRQCKARGRNS